MKQKPMTATQLVQFGVERSAAMKHDEICRKLEGLSHTAHYFCSLATPAAKCDGFGLVLNDTRFMKTNNYDTSSSS